MSYLLNNTGAHDLDVTIRCANLNGRPFELDRLRASLADEKSSTGPRVTIIKLLEREIKRQEKAQTHQIEHQPKGANMATSLTIPPLAEGEIYIGAIGDASGNLHHVILLPGDNDDATHESQLKWAKSIGGDLPNRIEQAMLWANHRDQFQNDWYWSNETYHSESGWAWYQYFGYGYQYDDYRLNELRARAVRRLPI